MTEAAFCLKCGTALRVTQYEDGHLHPVCPNCGWAYFPDPKVAAAVYLVQEGKVLLVRRVFDPHRGEWTLPAGFVNAGEEPAAAAARECLEETGITARVTGLRHVITGREHPRGADIVLVYSAEFISGAVLASDDADEAAFFPLDALPPLAFRATRVALGVVEA
jgi:ADP-ribose pyrophosphatase YjhB (NUDIX family)